MHRDVAVTARELPVELLRFRVRGVELLLAALDVDEIVPLGKVSQVPGVPPHIAGLMPLRGQALPLLDLAAFFEFPAAASSEDREPRVIVVGVPPFRVGLIVDAVLGVLPMPAAGMGDVTVLKPMRLRELTVSALDLGDALAAFLDIRLLLEAARA